jgi:hypothetical protein
MGDLRIVGRDDAFVVPSSKYPPIGTPVYYQRVRVMGYIVEQLYQSRVQYSFRA